MGEVLRVRTCSRCDVEEEEEQFDDAARVGGASIRSLISHDSSRGCRVLNVVHEHIRALPCSAHKALLLQIDLGRSQRGGLHRRLQPSSGHTTSRFAHFPTTDSLILRP